MNTVGRSLAVLAVLCSSVALAQAPQKIAYQGLLLKSDGTPETGTVQMKFAIFAAATGGTELWGETQANVALTQGFYATTLGETTAFPNTLFDGTERFLEISVGTPLVAMTPRMRVVSVPYAIAANTATNVNGGTVNASSISVGGNPVIDSSGNLVGNATYQGANGVSVTGRTIGLVPGCQAGETLKWSGAPTNAWQCAAGTPAAGDGGVITYTADPDGGLQLTGSNFTSFSLLRNCGANQILKWNGSAWACGNDNDTTYGVGSGQGLVLGGGLGNQFGLQSCATGQILKSGGGTWACQSDSDTTYTATVNKGLILNGTGFGIDPCPAGQIMKSQGSGNWACQTDDNTAYDVIVNGGLQKTGNNFGLGVCPSGQVLKSQGSGLWSCQQDNNAGGTVTQIITTAGISGGPITTTGTLSLSPTVPNWTATNPATCAPGEALRAVGNDGTPTCITITGGGTVLQITPGTGIRTTPDAGITTTGTISIGPLVPNWTATGPGTCPAGQAIQSLALDGTANCVTISLDGGGGGGGSVTSVGTGAGLTGGPITGSGTISVATGGITNTMLANSGVTVSAGTGLNGGGLVALGGTTTINLTTPVSAANGGTGIGGPTAAGQFLRSSAAGAWSVATLSAGDIPTLS